MSDTGNSKPDELSALSACERAAHYRGLAEMHLTLGQEARSPEVRASHLEMAALWTRLAAQADHPPYAGDPSA